MKIMKRTYLIYFILSFVFLQYSVKGQTTKELKDIRDIAYAGGLKDWKGKDEDSLRCDFYYPTGATPDRKYPVILNCHAGSFTSGNKRGQVSGSDALSDEGFVVVAFNYRVGYNSIDSVKCGDDTLGLNEAIYRATQDGNACMRFLYNYADSFHIDTSNMFIMGNSAGGDLALHMQYFTDEVAESRNPEIYAELGGLQTSGNPFPFKYKVKGLSIMWGSLPNWNLITPQSAVPTIYYKGGKDPGLPEGIGYFQKCKNYTELIAGIGIYRAMVAIGVPCIYHYQPLGFHSAYDEEFTVQSTACFLRQVMQNQAPTAMYTYYEGLCP